MPTKKLKEMTQQASSKSFRLWVMAVMTEQAASLQGVLLRHAPVS